MEPSELRTKYEAGATVEDLSLESGIYPGGVRRLLHEAGTEMRRPGQRVDTPHRHRADRSNDESNAMPTARIVRPSVQRQYR